MSSSATPLKKVNQVIRIKATVAIVHARFCCLPFEQISRECLLSENPILVNASRHFQGILSWEDCMFKYPTSIDKDLPSQGIYVHCIPEVGMQKLVYWMNHTQVSVGCNHKWLNRSMGEQPANVFQKDMNIYLLKSSF